MNRRTIESVEQEVERLLEQDAMAEDVKYGMFILVVDPARFSSDYPFQRSWTT